MTPLQEQVAKFLRENEFKDGQYFTMSQIMADFAEQWAERERNEGIIEGIKMCIGRIRTQELINKVKDILIQK